MKKLTIGMCCYDDIDGVYFTIQSIRMYHPEVLNDVEFLVIDNNPTSAAGKAIAQFCTNVSTSNTPVQYVPFSKYKSTIVRNKIFELADTPYVLCVDSHVMIKPGAIAKLIKFYDEGRDNGNLLQGPLINDEMTTVSPSMDRAWIDVALGSWAQMPIEQFNFDGEPFEIQAQGLGLFSCRKDKWQGFNKLMRGFGCEEIYIHDKYKKNGFATACLPFLGWVHRFFTTTSSNANRELDTHINRYRNYIIGRLELDMPVEDVDEVFKRYLSNDEMSAVKREVAAEMHATNSFETRDSARITGYNPTQPFQHPDYAVTDEQQTTTVHVQEQQPQNSSVDIPTNAVAKKDAIVQPGQVKDETRFSGIYGHDPRLGSFENGIRGEGVVNVTVKELDRDKHEWKRVGPNKVKYVKKEQQEEQAISTTKQQQTDLSLEEIYPQLAERPQVTDNQDDSTTKANTQTTSLESLKPDTLTILADELRTESNSANSEDEKVKITNDLTVIKRVSAPSCCGKGTTSSSKKTSTANRTSLKKISRAK